MSELKQKQVFKEKVMHSEEEGAVSYTHLTLPTTR